MARDYLVIPATSAPIERVFSRGTDLVAQRRCNLKGKIIHEVMCLKGWLKLLGRNCYRKFRKFRDLNFF